MAAYRTARSFLTNAPREALTDALGVATAGGVIFLGFVVPGLF